MIVQILTLFMLLFLFVQILRMGLSQYYEEKIYSLKQAPKRKKGLLFCNEQQFESGNKQMLEDRLMTAVWLYMVGGVDKLILGAPAVEIGQEMEQLLVEGGVMRRDISFLVATDLAAFSRQLYEMGEEESFILLTQQLLLPRALFICEQAGLELVGVIADRHPYSWSFQFKSWVRECGSMLMNLFRWPFGLKLA